MSRTTSEQGDGREEFGLSVNFVNEAVPRIESTHQSGGQHRPSGQDIVPVGTAAHCLPNEEVTCLGFVSCQQPVQDVCLVIAHGSLSENVEQENALGTSLLECSVTTPNSDCQTDLEVGNESSMLSGPEPCDNDTVKDVEIKGCDVDVAPDQVSKEFVLDPCAGHQNFACNVSQIYEPCRDIDFVGTVEVSDGREKFSEKSGHSQQDDVKPFSYSNSILVVCDRGDLICPGSVSRTSNMVSEGTGIQNETKDCGAEIQEKLGNVIGAPCSSNDLCKGAEKLSLYPELYISLAACVVDEILDKASKSVSELRSIDVTEIGLKHENISKQISDNGEQVVTKSPEITAVVSENSVIDLESLDLSSTSYLKSSYNSVSNIVSENGEIPGLTPHDGSDLHSDVEHTMQDQAPVMCNGNILLSKQGNNCSGSKPASSCFHVSVTTDCDKEVKRYVIGDSEVKASSNDCLITGEYANKDAEYYLHNSIMMGRIIEKEDVPSAIDSVERNLHLSDANFASTQAKVNCSKDVSCGESSLEPTSSCLKDSSPSVEHKKEINSACFTKSHLSSENRENENINVIWNKQVQILEGEKSLNDPAAVIKLDPNVDDTDFVYAVPGHDSNVDAVDYLTCDCMPVKNETVCLELSVAQVQGITEGKVGGDKTPFREIADRETESSHALEDLLPRDGDSVNDEEASVSSFGIKDSIANESIVDNHTGHSDKVTTIIGDGEGSTEKLETIVGEVIEKVVSICEVSDRDTSNAETVAAITEEDDRTSDVPITVVGVKAIPGEIESDKTDQVVEEKTAIVGVVSKESEFASDEPETNFEEPIASADTAVCDTFQTDTDIFYEEPKDDLVTLDSAEEISSDLLSEVPEIKPELIPLNSGCQDVERTFSTVSQMTVPTVNVCPPITEETYEGLTDDESEISHATSDSESDSNVKMVKPVCDGVNTINYRPLLEEDSNDRSTLSLISELDDASVREDNAETEQWENESASLILDDGVDSLESTVSSCELVERVKGRRIRHNKMTVKTEENYCSEEESVDQDIPWSEYASKIKDIREALKCSDSLERLRAFAQSAGGLVADEIRKEAWPRLLGIDTSTLNSPLPPISTEELHVHKEYNQVVLDVNRSLRRFPSKISAVERTNLQNQLTEIILRVLMKRGDLSYYQGYHDVAVTTLLVAGKDIAFHILEHISVSHLSDCMLPTMERTIYLLNYIYPLLQRINPNVVERMDRLEIGTIFCLPWYLTWYGYSLNRYEDIVRVFDYFLASPPLAPLYLAAVVVGRRSAEVLAADSDHATVHSLLSRIPESLPLEELLQEASCLYRQYPPEKIKVEVEERCERLRKAQEEEEEQRKLIRQSRKRVQRRHSMPTIAARQMAGWYYLDRFLGFPVIQRNRLIQVSATVFLGVIAWQWRDEMARYF